MDILRPAFFNRPAPEVARDLLGKFLVRRIGKKIIWAMIAETEAYEGFKDKASHASRGRTPRNFVMFGPPGRWYVYFTYGRHWMLNIVTGPKNYPAAVLIRSVIINFRASDVLILTSMLRTSEARILNGPAKLTKFLKIDQRFNNKSANTKTGLWLTSVIVPARQFIRRSFSEGGSLGDGGRSGTTKQSRRFKIKTGSRIGVSYAGPYWAKKRWRFYQAPSS